METKPIEIYSEASNFAIVRVPGRQFPGCVIQGDSLSILVADAREIWERVKSSSDEELVLTARDLLDKLQSRLEHYEGTLTAHKIPLPYNRSEK